jgi:hypothetical protein
MRYFKQNTLLLISMLENSLILNVIGAFQTMLSIMDVNVVMIRLTNILQSCSLPRDPNHYKTGFWGRAQVIVGNLINERTFLL